MLQFYCIFFAEDPVRILKHPSNAMNSVMKIFIDIFSIKETAGLFYTTDNKVLIDIVVRQLSDLCAGNPVSNRIASIYYLYSIFIIRW